MLNKFTNNDPNDPFVMQCKLKNDGYSYERYYCKCSKASLELIDIKYEISQGLFSREFNIIKYIFKPYQNNNSVLDGYRDTIKNRKIYLKWKNISK